MREFLAAVLAVGAVGSARAAEVAPAPRPAEWGGEYRWAEATADSPPTRVTVTARGGVWTHTAAWGTGAGAVAQTRSGRMVPRPDVGGPAAFDLVGPWGDAVPGVWKAEGGVLTVALGARAGCVDPTAVRPAGFAPGRHVAVFELRRVDRR